MRNERLLVLVAGLAGVALVVLAIVYWVEPDEHRRVDYDAPVSAASSAWSMGSSPLLT